MNWQHVAVNPKNQIRNILVRIKNQSEYTPVSESGLIYMQWAYHQDLTSHSDEDLTTTWGWLREESQYTPQCDKGLWGLTTSMSSIQVPVNLEKDPDEPLSLFSPMTAPRLWSELFLAIRGGCRFLFSLQRLSRVWAAFRPSRTAVEFLFVKVAL